MAHQTAERPAWTVRQYDMVLGNGRVRSVSQLPETDALCIVFADGNFIIVNANETVSVITTVKG